MTLPFNPDDLEIDADLRALREAEEIRKDPERLNRVRGRIEEKRRELDHLADQMMDEPDLPEEGVIKLGGLDKDGQ